MAIRYDAIVIGGGHNGLVAGAYLARGGAKTVVLEAHAKCGGAAATEAPWPEAPQFKVTKYSYVMSLMPDTILRDLKLKEHGYKVYPMGPYYQAWPDGRSLKLYADDAKANYDSVARFSKKDAETMPKWDEWLRGIADVMGPLLMHVPPKLGAKSPGALMESLQTAWKLRKLDVRGVADVTRLFTMSATDLLDDWFESPQVKAALTINGVIGTWAGPDSPGTAYVLLHHSIGNVGDGHLGSWG
ncbi:MAG TPA: NAD(P)-binding protein, partial [Vicinamibacteria bacterium]|nr:NAD(P)-binding protein [Vicinamibacteria bacterium]